MVYQLKRRVTLLTAMITALVLIVGAMPAAAHEGGGGIQGSGTIAPGLSEVPRNQSVTFTGSGVAVSDGPHAAGTFTCTFTGGSTSPETLAGGSGTATGSCSGNDVVTNASLGANCTVRYVRVAGEVHITGTCAGDVDGNVSAECSFEADPGLPVTSYSLQCVFVFHHQAAVAGAAGTITTGGGAVTKFVNCLLGTPPTNWVVCVQNFINDLV